VDYAAIFKAECPTAYSYAYDDPTSTFTCDGNPVTGYSITFCGGTPGYIPPGGVPKLTAKGASKASSTSKKSSGSVIGIVVGVILGVALITGILVFAIYRRNGINFEKVKSRLSKHLSSVSLKRQSTVNLAVSEPTVAAPSGRANPVPLSPQPSLVSLQSANSLTSLTSQPSSGTLGRFNTQPSSGTLGRPSYTPQSTGTGRPLPRPSLPPQPSTGNLQQTPSFTSQPSTGYLQSRPSFSSSTSQTPLRPGRPNGKPSDASKNPPRDY